MKNNNPIRMCIACRKREPQKLLIRLQLINEKVVAYQGSGRSIYVCWDCSLSDKKMNGFAKRFGVKSEELFMILKELDKNGES